MPDKFHLDLTEDGLPGQWLEVTNILLKSPKQFGEVLKLKEDATPESARAFLASVITAWHVKNPMTGEPLPAPDDPALDLDDLPLIVSVRFQEAIGKQMEEANSKANAFGKR